MAQLMPLPLIVSYFSKIQTGFTFLVPAHLGSPGQRAVKRACKCVCVCACVCILIASFLGKILTKHYENLTVLAQVTVEMPCVKTDSDVFNKVKTSTAKELHCDICILVSQIHRVLNH